jgi:hypothetical protein
MPRLRIFILSRDNAHAASIRIAFSSTTSISLG